MEETPEGMAVARATREAAKRKREEVIRVDAPANKRTNNQATSRPPPSCTHEVATPDDYDVETKGLDPDTYGAYNRMPPV